jgi:hypothetical protein
MTNTSRRARAAAWATAGVLGGLGAGVVVAQLGVAGAADPSPTPSASASADPNQPAPPMMGRPGGPMGGPGLGPELALGGRVLHGQATVKTRDGELREVANQAGKITAIDGSTLTVRSSDDFTRDYTVDEDTRIALNGEDGALSSLKTGDTVHVMAVKAGGSWHAEGVLDGVPPRPMLGRDGGFERHGGLTHPE